MALIERLQRNVDATRWAGEIPLQYIYTAGRGGELFYLGIKERGEFVATRCEACGVTYLPAMMYCERCMDNIEANTIVVPNEGEVYTFTVSHETFDEQEPTFRKMIESMRIDTGLSGLWHSLPRMVRLFIVGAAAGVLISVLRALYNRNRIADDAAP